MRKWAGGILGAVLLILLAASCAPRYFCSSCGKLFTGTIYCDAGGEKILCLDCAVRYYSPLAPQKEEWSRGRGEGRRWRGAFAAEEAGEPASFGSKFGTRNPERNVFYSIENFKGTSCEIKRSRPHTLGQLLFMIQSSIKKSC